MGEHRRGTDEKIINKNCCLYLIAPYVHVEMYVACSHFAFIRDSSQSEHRS